MSHLTISLLLLASACLFQQSHAGATSSGWLDSITITALDSGGDLLYLTASNTSSHLVLAVFKGVVTVGNQGSAAPPPQAFDVSAGWPLSTFTLRNGLTGLYLDFTNGQLTMQPQSNLANQLWATDDEGRILSSSGLFISAPMDSTYTYAVKFSTIYLGPKSKQAAQRFKFNPTGEAPSGFLGTISYLNLTETTRMCYDSGNYYNLTVGGYNPPFLSPCDPTNPGQAIAAIDIINAVTGLPGHFPDGQYQLRFVSTGMCLGVIESSYDPSITQLVQCQCNSLYAVTYWLYSSRGQLESVLPGYSSAGTKNGLALCATLQEDGTNSINIDKCTYKLPSQNRVSFNYIIPV